MKGIYTILNNTNGKIYVGYSSDFEKRKLQHVNSLVNNKHDNEHLQNVFNKHGNVFEIELIEECEEDFLCALEHYWCNILNAHNRDFGYNILPTSPEGKHNTHSLETRRKISSSRKGWKNSEEMKAKISTIMKGRTSPNKGKIMSKLQRDKLSFVKKGIPSPIKGKRYTEEEKMKHRFNSGRFIKGKEMKSETVKKSAIGHYKLVVVLLYDEIVYNAESVKDAAIYLKGKKKGYKFHTFKYGY